MLEKARKRKGWVKFSIMREKGKGEDNEEDRERMGEGFWPWGEKNERMKIGEVFLPEGEKK